MSRIVKDDRDKNEMILYILKEAFEVPNLLVWFEDSSSLE